MYKFELFDKSLLPHLGCSLEFFLTQGEGMVLTGPNGIGKTTVLKRFFEIYNIDFGITLVAQAPLDFFYDRPLKEIRKILHQTRAEALDQSLFNTLWDGFGLSNKEDRPLSVLSGGELQALKICCGLGRNGKIGFLDEPFQSLDSSRKRFLIQLLDDLKTKGHTFLLVEHDLSGLSSGWKVQPLVVKNKVLGKGESWTI